MGIGQARLFHEAQLDEVKPGFDDPVVLRRTREEAASLKAGPVVRLLAIGEREMPACAGTMGDRRGRL
jgi:hypothetical protein